MKYMTFGFGGDTFVVQDQIQAFNKNPEAKTTQPSEIQIRETYASIEAALRDSSNNGLHNTFREWMVGLQTYNPELARSLLKTEVLQTLKLQATEQASVQVNTLRSSMDSSANGPKQDMSEQKIKEILSELSPEKIDASLRQVESVIDIVTDPRYQMVLRSFAGALFLEKFETNNQRIVVRSDNSIQIEYIDPSQSTQTLDANNKKLQTNITALIREKPAMIDTIRSGMLWRAQTSAIARDNPSKGMVVMKMKSYSNEDMHAYFKKIAENQNSTTAEKTLSLSQSGFADFKNPPELQDVLKLETSIQKLSSMQQSVPLPLDRAGNSSPQSGNQIPSVVGEGVGMIGGAIGKIVGSGAKGGLSVITDMFNSANKEGGAMGGLAVLGMIIASIWKFGFLKTIGGIFGVGLVSEAAAGRLDLGKEADKLKKAGEKGVAAVGSLATSAQGVVADVSDSAIQSGQKLIPNTGSTPEVRTTDTQKWFRESIMKDGSLNTRVDTFSADQKKYKNEQTGKLDDYVKFIETDLQDVPLSRLFTTNHIESVFYDGPESSLPSKTELGKKMLKLVLRAYLMGSNYDTLTGSGDTMGKTEQDEFLKMYDIKDTDITTKKLSDILPIIQKKRGGGRITSTPLVAPTVSSVPSAKISIQGGEAVLRDNVKVNSPNGILAYDKDGKILTSSANLPKDTMGKHFVPNAKIVQIESAPLLINAIEFIEVSYAGERFYIPKSVLSKI